MAGQDVRIKSSPDGEFGGYLASPASGRGPGIVVIQEIFGVNKVMRQVADEFAARGYFALCPDLFWRLEPGVQLTDRTDEEWKRAFDLMGRFDQDLGVKDIQNTINYLRHSVTGCTGKVGAVGYCLGGLLAYLTAARTDADAAVGYYGVNIQDKLAEAPKIRKPLMLHVAQKDEYVPPEAQKKMIEGLKGNALVTIHSYPEMNHAFARAGGAHYDKACADLANGRTSTFFRQHLSDMPATRLIFARHGESRHSLAGVQGTLRTCKGLTARGHEQAEALAADLAKRAPDAVAVYASPLRRAQETAAPIAERLGLGVITAEGLLTWKQPVEADNLPNEEYLRRYEQPGGGVFRGFQTVGESWSDLVVRTGKGLTEIMQAHPGKTVILIGHTESIMAGFIVLGSLPLMAPFEAKSDPTGITIWETDGDVMAFPGPRWVLHGFNIVPQTP